MIDLGGGADADQSDAQRLLGHSTSSGGESLRRVPAMRQTDVPTLVSAHASVKRRVGGVLEQPVTPQLFEQPLPRKPKRSRSL